MAEDLIARLDKCRHLRNGFILTCSLDDFLADLDSHVIMSDSASWYCVEAAKTIREARAALAQLRAAEARVQAEPVAWAVFYKCHGQETSSLWHSREGAEGEMERKQGMANYTDVRLAPLYLSARAATDEALARLAIQFGQMRGGWMFEQAWEAWQQEGPELLQTLRAGEGRP